MPVARMKSGARSSAKVVQLHPKRKPYGKASSYEQLRQRELAWMLYITEGYAANIAHAQAVNCVTFTAHDNTEIDRIIRLVEQQADRLRTLLQVL